jgi:O-methyltransferase
MAPRSTLEHVFGRGVHRLLDWLSYLALTLTLLHPARIHPSHRLSLRSKLRLARRLQRTVRHVQTGTSPRAHLVMAAKLLSVPPDVEGVIVEAGSWKGGTTANLSIIADLVGRDLIVYDSFEGLPAAADGDKWASTFGEGAFRGELDEVKANVAANGEIERCEFREGWFSETMPGHREPIVAAFVDVDRQSSMHECLLGLWPHLVDRGYLFVDEFTRLDYCAVFFSERYWRTYFDRPPPGLLGAGTGVAVGQLFPGPARSPGPYLDPQSVGFTRKDYYGAWDYFPDGDATPLPGGPGAAHGREGWFTTTLPVEAQDEARYAELVASDDERRQRLEEALTSTEEGQRKLAEALERHARSED